MAHATRRVVLSAHLTVSVGWIGAVLAYLTLVIAAMLDRSDRLLYAAWTTLPVIGWFVIVPLALLALATGLGIALATPWGVFRHYWVMASLLLTVVANGVLLNHMRTVSLFSSVNVGAGARDLSAVLRPALRGEIVHAGLGLVVLLAILALNVYKPRGLTAYGRGRSDAPIASDSLVQTRTISAMTGTPRWVHAIWIHAAVLVAALAILHLTSGGPRLHN